MKKTLQNIFGNIPLRTLPIFVIGLFIFNNSNAQTYVTGGIYSNTTWTTAGSPYIITDTVVVFSGITLTIQPGVVVKFDNDSGLIEVRGNLYANGTPTDSIIFTSNSLTPYAGIYNGIQISSDTASFRYCRFSYATGAMGGIGYCLPIAHCRFYSNLTAISDYGALNIDTCTFQFDSLCINLPGPETVITNCNFRQNGKGIIEFEGFLYNSIFSRNNDFAIQGGYSISTIAYCTIDSNPIGIDEINGDTIRNNSIKYNNVGLTITEDNFIFLNDISDNQIGIETYGDKMISCNTICGNTQYNIVSGFSTNASISNNYWCLSDSIHIQPTIYDAYQDIHLGFLYFTPFDTVACTSIPTGVNDLSIVSEEITLYPNPNSGSFTISIGNYAAGINTIEVYNMLGEKVYTSTITQSTSQIKLHNNSPGVYLYRVISGNGSLAGSGKFVVE